MTIEDILIQQYGPLLTIVQLATVLKRSPEGLRVSLRADSNWARQINRARLRIGRRVYFRSLQIAEFLDALSN